MHARGEDAEAFLRTIVRRVDDSGTVGILLIGSRARGDASVYSDWDITRYVAEGVPLPQSQKSVMMADGQLVTVYTTTVEAKREELRRPGSAIWAVAGLQQARVLLDRDGSVTALVREAEEFSWEPLRPAARRWASHQMAGYAEEALKVVAGLERGDDSAVLYASLGMLLGMTETMSVWREALVPTENAHLRVVQEAAGKRSAWTRWHRAAAGYNGGDVHQRGVGALRAVPGNGARREGWPDSAGWGGCEARAASGEEERAAGAFPIGLDCIFSVL
jgi:hypothetical protein